MTRKGLMVHGMFPCIRVGKTTEAMNTKGWEHDVLSLLYPPQLEEAYRHVIALRNGTRDDFKRVIENSDAEIIQVHNEPNWPVGAAKDVANGRPVIMNVHDIGSMRGHWIDVDPEGRYREDEAYHRADALVFTAVEQREYGVAHGLVPANKRFIVLPNYASRETFVEYYKGKPPLPFIGGVVYAGGVDRAGSGKWRDLSPVAETIPLHIYPGGPNLDYGIRHDPILAYPLLIQHMARYDWGFTGMPRKIDAWRFTHPNKVFEYLAAGIPFIAMNSDALQWLVDEGLGVACETLEELQQIVKNVDPAPYKERVMEQRHRFSMEYNIDELAKLYDELLEGGVKDEGDGRHLSLQSERATGAGPILGPTAAVLGHRAPRGR